MGEKSKILLDILTQLRIIYWSRSRDTSLIKLLGDENVST